MKVLLAVTGSVSAILTPKMVAALSEIGDVKVIVSKSSEQFIDFAKIPESIPVLGEEDERRWRKRGDSIPHIDLTDWADAMLVAPMTANTLSKMANGIGDNIVSNSVLAWDYRKPIVVALAANPRMLENPFVRNNLAKVRQQAFVIDPVEKTLMCGTTGRGALESIQKIVAGFETYVRRGFGLSRKILSQELEEFNREI